MPKGEVRKRRGPLFKRRWKRKDGTWVESTCFYALLRDASGKRRRVKLSRDKRVSMVMLGKLLQEAELRRAGIINRFAEQEKRPLMDHLADYAKDLAAKNRTRGYVMASVTRIRRVVEACRFASIRDIDPTAVSAYLADLRKAQGLSVTTTNHYLRAVKGFAAWLMKNNRSSENRLAYLAQLNADDDRRRERRALTPDEARRLVAAAERGPTIQGLSGPLRALCYRLALTTGLRRKEIASLTWDSFNLDGPTPTVTVEAAYSKHRRRDVLPLSEETADALRRWRTEHALFCDPRNAAPGSRVLFPLSRRTADMLRQDLAAAGIEYEDAVGRRVDFHALRHTFITNLARGGVHPKVAQALARHSTITLTMDHYTHLETIDYHSALKALPDLTSPIDAHKADLITGAGNG